MSHSFRQITPTDKFGWHAAYLEVYEKLFATWKDKPVNLLEIGTDGGGGLRMYQDYFAKGGIYGFDISPCPDAAKDQQSICHTQIDAYTQPAVELARGLNLDIIIDDGSHQYGHQKFFAEHYAPLVSKSGIAIIEDIQDAGHVELLQRSLPASMGSMSVDLRHIDPKRYDNLLLVAWK